MDDRDDERMGFKINKWEVKGVPIRVEVGNREVENNQVTAARRWDGAKETVALDEFVRGAAQRLGDIQDMMLEGSKELTKARTVHAANYEDFKKAMQKEEKGFIEVYWNDDPEVEAKVKEETKATSRCCIGEGEGVDFYTGKPATKKWIFAQSY